MSNEIDLPGWLGFLDGSACAPIPDNKEGEVIWPRIGAQGSSAYDFQEAYVRLLKAKTGDEESAATALSALIVTMDEKTRAYIADGWGGQVDVRGMGTGLLN